MEQEIKIKTPDNHIIYGTLNSLSKNNETLIILVHGLTGNQYEHHYFNAAPFFNKKGFNAFRFNFYAKELNARPLSESTITTHAKDLETIIKHFRDKYKNIVLVGHSLGAFAILNVDLSNISKIVLWDPTINFKYIKEKNGFFDPYLDKYVLHRGMDILISKKMVEEWKKSEPKNLVDKIIIPCKFIFAGDLVRYNVWKPFLKKIKVKNEITIVEGATHCFYEEGTEQKLFEETLNFL